MSIKHFMSAVVIFVAGFATNAFISDKSPLSSAKSLEPAVAAQANQTPSTSQRWEYRVVTISKDGLFSGYRRENVEKELNQLGEQGFEIWRMTQSSSNVGFYTTIVLRRSSPRQQVATIRKPPVERVLCIFTMGVSASVSEFSSSSASGILVVGLVIRNEAHYLQRQMIGKNFHIEALS